MNNVRCEHNCHLCKKESLGRCHGTRYGSDVSVNDRPICEAYDYGGSQKHLYEIQYAQSLGVTQLPAKDLAKATATYLWEQLTDVPMNPETEELEQPYLHFPVGTHREVIWHWIEDTFPGVRVHDLMHPEQPEPATEDTLLFQLGTREITVSRQQLGQYADYLKNEQGFNAISVDTTLRFLENRNKLAVMEFLNWYDYQ